MVLGLGAPPARAQQSARPPIEPVELKGRLQGTINGDSSNNQVTAWFVPNAAAALAGPSIQLLPADDATRAQLKLPDGRGLIVTAVPPASATGVQKDDILLLIDDTPLAKPQDLEARLKAAGEKTLRLDILHEGKPKSLTIRPLVVATFEEVRPAPSAYWIGVRVTPASPALRSQLGLEADGLIVAEVLKEGPAVKAGLQAHDLLLKLEGQPLKDQAQLTGLVQKSGGKPLKLDILRAGKPVQLELTPEPRKDENAQTTNSELIYQALVTHPGTVFSGQGQDFFLSLAPGQETNRFQTVLQAPPADQRIDALAAQVKELQKAVEELTKAIKDRK
ncbi:PDZ domain-containing protein [Aquisphaera insulae]|uniref:PDZ domain-containing protein n=1 Tax=Aquisphaera insulae TaxID=2712864 RepID=UPI0013EC4C6C|nr:PDZ domain-containing protein [Aquisphaera insulae]